MGERLTNKWTETAEQAFGKTGAKGRKGELFLLKVFDKWGWESKDHESSYGHQVRGIDVSFRKPTWFNWYTADVKNNMRDDGKFAIYSNWLFKTESDRVFHVNPEKGLVAWYGVEEMRKAYMKCFPNWDYAWIGPTDMANYVSRAYVDFS